MFLFYIITPLDLSNLMSNGYRYNQQTLSSANELVENKTQQIKYRVCWKKFLLDKKRNVKFLIKCTLQLILFKRKYYYYLTIISVFSFHCQHEAILCRFILFDMIITSDYNPPVCLCEVKVGGSLMSITVQYSAVHIFHSNISNYKKSNCRTFLEKKKIYKDKK